MDTNFQAALNGSFCTAKIFTMDFPTVPGPLWVWIPPMSTYIRVICYLLNCRRGTLKMYSALRLKRLNTPTLTLVQPKAFKQHFARWEHSLFNSPDDSQAITEYDYTAGRCCLYRIVTIDLPTCYFFAGGCLGWSRAERPSVSWTKVLETLCLQQPKEMLNIKFCKNMQRATGTNKVQTRGKECRVSRGHKEEGSGEI